MNLPKAVLGDTGIEVTELCFGTLTMSPIQADLPPEEGGRLIRSAIEKGITFFDTAQGYRAYPHMREGLKNADRNRLVIATKSHAKTGEEMNSAFEEACTEMNTDYIDIFHLHLISSPDDFDSRRGAFEALKNLRKQGRVKAIGISAHSIEPFRYVMNNHDIDICFPTFNLRSLGINDGTVGEMADVMDEIRKRGKGTYAMKPLGGGHLGKTFDEALDFVRQHGCIDAVALGMKHENELDLNLAYFRGETITDEMRNTVRTVDRKLVINRLCVKCGICVRGCEQKALSLGEEKAEVDMSKCILCGYCQPACPRFAIRVI